SARANVERAGVADLGSIERADLASLPPAPAASGLICVNPPYGQRLGGVRELAPLYAQLGAVLRHRYRRWRAGVLTGKPRLGRVRELARLFAQLGAGLRERYRGWRAAVLTGNPPLGRELGIRAKRTHRLFNGAIECRLLRFELAPEQFTVPREPGLLPASD